jgi:sterol 3beta-glucosyltransferase
MIVHPLLLFYAATLSEKLNKPFILATPFPFAPATKEFPQFLVRAKRLPLGLLNLLTHRLFAKVYEKGKAADMNEWRSTLGLTPLRGSVFKNLVAQRIPILHAYSSSLVPHPKDWREHNLISGQLKLDATHLPEQIGADSNADLEQWLDRGQAPIYFGFGSLPILEPQKNERYGPGNHKIFKYQSNHSFWLVRYNCQRYIAARIHFND